MSKTPTAAADRPADVEAMSFEAALNELEGIVDKLEHGDVKLEESIAMYERGNALKAHCDAKLKAAQTRIDKIVSAGGALSTEPTDLG